MDFLNGILLLVGSYLIGSIPIGMLVVKLKTGKDIRKVESGRTGGTNTMRAAGVTAGAITGILDGCKAGVTALLAQSVFPQFPWMHIFAPLAAVLGHNYSLYLLSRDENGKLRFHGGAGGAPTIGGAIGLWLPNVFILPLMLVLVLFGIGYASVATLTAGIASTLIFAILAWLGKAPWQYIFFGLFAEVLLIWALRPNIQRLRNGTERKVSWKNFSKKK